MESITTTPPPPLPYSLSSLGSLPNDVIRLILGTYLDDVDFMFMRLVNKRIRDLSKHFKERLKKATKHPTSCPYLHAAIYGYHTRLEWLHMRARVPISCFRPGPECFEACVKRNDRAAIEWFVTRSPRLQEQVCSAAALCGNPAVLQWLLFEKKYYWNEKQTIELAVMSGSLETIKWCLENGCAFSEYLIEQAAWKNHTHIVQWAFDTFPSANKALCAEHSNAAHVCRAAATLDNLEIFTRAWRLLDRSHTFIQKYSGVAAASGSMKVLQFIADENLLSPHTACVGAIQGGQHIRVLEFVRNLGHPLLSELYIRAIWKENMSIVQWLYDNHVLFDESACVAAAETGQLAVLVWLRQHNCPWDSVTCLGAAGRGRLETLQWSLENGCPWHDNALTEAKNQHRDRVVEWLEKEFLPKKQQKEQRGK
jgi:hypothetical protein